MNAIGPTPTALHPPIIILLLLLMPAQAASEPPVAARGVIDDRNPIYPVAFAEGVTGFSHLTYATLPGYRPLTLDLYLPAESTHAPATGFPLVVYTHGGARLCGGLGELPPQWRSPLAGGGDGSQDGPSLASFEGCGVPHRPDPSGNLGCDPAHCPPGLAARAGSSAPACPSS